MRESLNHGLNGWTDDTDEPPFDKREQNPSVKSINPCQSVVQTMQKNLNHGLNGWTDDTDEPPFDKREQNPSVKSINPCQSVVQTGYKQTEVGVIPEDWNAVDMEKITAHIGDGLHGTPIYSPNGDYFFVNGNNLSGGKVVVTSDTKSVDYSEFIKHRKPLSNRSILLSINGTIGNLALFDDEQIVLGKSAAYLNIRPEVCKHFIYHALQTDIVRRQFFDGLTGSTIGNLGLATIRKTQIPLPSTVVEQRAIAAALSDVDALLAKFDQLIAKKRDIKQAAMQQLLPGKKRLPGFSGEWELKRLGDITTLRRDRIDPRKSGVQEFCVELEHIEPGAGRLLGSNSTSEESSIKSVFQPGDVLFGKLRAYLRKYWLADRGGVCSTEIWALVANRRCATAEFLLQIITTDKFIEAASVVYGTHMPRSDWNVVKNYEVALPILEEQTAIATVLSDMDAEIAALEVRRDKTRDLKQGMMQELLTGRIRLV